MSYIVDTQIITRLVRGTLSVDDLPTDHAFLAPRVQIDQIKRATDKGLRARLLLKFSSFAPERVSMGAILLDGAYWEDFRRWDDTLFRALTDAFRRGCHSGTNARDILIAEVAITGGLTFLTDDPCLARIVREHGGQAKYWHGGRIPRVPVRR